MRVVGAEARRREAGLETRHVYVTALRTLRERHRVQVGSARARAVHGCRGPQISTSFSAVAIVSRRWRHSRRRLRDRADVLPLARQGLRGRSVHRPDLQLGELRFRWTTTGSPTRCPVRCWRATLLCPPEMIWSKAFIMERERRRRGRGAPPPGLRTSSDWRLLQRFGPAVARAPEPPDPVRLHLSRERATIPGAVMRSCWPAGGTVVGSRTGAGLRGTLISRQQYLLDVTHGGYAMAARAARRMTAAEMRTDRGDPGGRIGSPRLGRSNGRSSSRRCRGVGDLHCTKASQGALQPCSRPPAPRPTSSSCAVTSPTMDFPTRPRFSPGATAALRIPPSRCSQPRLRGRAARGVVASFGCRVALLDGDGWRAGTWASGA
jgi:hypothetical protein